MNIQKRAYLILFSILVCIASFLWIFRYQIPEVSLGKEEVTLVAPDGSVEKIVVEIADDFAEQSRGLMFRESLPRGEGMLFVFQEERDLSFWMKNTRIPLDIVYFDVQGQFVSRTSMVPCKNDPCETYPSKGKAFYVLEVNRAELKTQSIGIGWKLQR